MASDGFFEGTEKKVELTLDPALPSLRARGGEYWSRIARTAGAEVLSTISSEAADAYLLSESSMFVFDHRLLLITCGRTSPVRAVPEVLRDLPADGVRQLVYERKNEVFPHRQPSSFYDDARALNALLPGRALRFGDEDGHHVCLFHLDREGEVDADDVAVEVLMYGLDPAVAEAFRPAAGRTPAEVRKSTGVETILPGYRMDDHLFEPSGYSLNAVDGDRYWTLHVTPDPPGSYASFESNAPTAGGLESLTRRIVEIFRPRSFDLVLFDRSEPGRLDLEPYRPAGHVMEDLSCGYRVRFLSYFAPRPGITRPAELPVV